MHYNFYFDETFHDRKISISEKGKINVLDDNANESYIGLFWGCENTRIKGVIKQLRQLENKYKEIYSLGEEQEFKSTTIGKQNFTYGINTFNDVTHIFYMDYFSTMLKISPILQINVISKIELYLRRIFRNTVLPPYVNEKVFYYSLTKFFIIYHNPTLLAMLWKVNDKKTAEIFKITILHDLKMIIDATKLIPRKERERSAFMWMYHIIDSICLNLEIEHKCDFWYEPNFDGFCKLLQELNIKPSKINLLIDKEKNTYTAGEKYSFHTISEGLSHNSIQLRFADHLCGFIGRMMYALDNDDMRKEDKFDNIEKLNNHDIVRKHILNDKWFELSEQQFKLYKLIYQALIVTQEHYWSTMTLGYGDQATEFYALLRYFASYNSYTDYSKIENKMHSEYYNTACCCELENTYRKFEKFH